MTNVPFLNSVTNVLSKNDVKGLELADALMDITEGNEKLDDLLTLQSSASEIDGSVNNKINFIVGDNLYDLPNDKELLTAQDFIGTISNGTPFFENSNELFSLKFGTSSLKIGNSTAGSSSLTDKSKTLENAIDLSSLSFVTFWVYAPEEHIVSDGSASYLHSNFKFFIYDSSNNYYGTHVVTSAMASLQSGWNNITIPLSKFRLNNTSLPELSDISKFRIQFETRNSNIGVPFYIDSIIFSTTGLVKTPICITIDDGLEDSYEMIKIMNYYGIPVSTFVTSYKVGETGFLSLDRLKELYFNGNHIGIHGHEFNIFASDTSQITLTSNWLKENGFTRDRGYLYGTYPNGGYSQETIDFLRNNGYLGFRQVIGTERNDTLGVQASKGILRTESLLNGGIADVHKISGHRPLTYTAFVSEIDNAIEFNGCYLPYHHSFSEVGGKSNWILMAKYLKQKIDEGLIECLTFPEFVQKYSI